MGHHIIIGAGLIGGGIYSQLPKTNEELAAADKVMTGKRGGKKVLNVNARIIKPQLLKDEIQISGSLLPDEEVDPFIRDIRQDYRNKL